jgi:hypothetical protein
LSSIERGDERSEKAAEAGHPFEPIVRAHWDQGRRELADAPRTPALSFRIPFQEPQQAIAFDTVEIEPNPRTSRSTREDMDTERFVPALSLTPVP